MVTAVSLWGKRNGHCSKQSSHSGRHNVDNGHMSKKEAVADG